MQTRGPVGVRPEPSLRGCACERCQQVISIWSAYRNHRHRRDRPPGRRRRARLHGRDRGAGHRLRQAGPHARAGLLPADRELRGEDLRRGPHPRRLLQARGTSRPRRRRSPRGSSTVPSGRCSPTASTTTCRWSPPCCRWIRTSTPTSRRSSAPRRRSRCRGFRSTVRSARRASAGRTARYLLNPTAKDLTQSQLHLVVAGTEHAGAHGGVGSEGTVRGGDARRRGVRPRADAGRHPRHPRARRRRPASRAGAGSRPRRTPS